jgi:Ca-activated chloride channel family protein
LKKILSHIFLILLVYTAQSQYYFRGQVKDEKNQPLSNVRIWLHSNKLTHSSGSTGDFGISIYNNNDSATFSLEGYEQKTIKIKIDIPISVILKVLTYNNNRNRPKLISVTKDQAYTNKLKWTVSDETYFQLVENEFVDAEKFPNTGISINVNKASYSNIRRFLNAKSTVPPDAIRTEELLNYFNLNYIEPDKNDVFKIQSQLTSCPWSNYKQLLYININAKKLSLDKIPPGNFVFLIDVSGSMDMPNRLPLLQAAFQLFVKNLRPVDTVSIVTYGGGISIRLTPTSGAEKEKILQSIEALTASGDTPGEAGIMTAYKLAQSTFIKNGNNRVILATDGDFNVGQTSEKALDQLITKMRQTGVYLTCLGVGMGNFKDSKLETLAKKGNGNFAYLDDLKEAEKVLVKELTQTFYTVADDVFMNIEFDPAVVKEYRLIGFDNKKDAVAENINDVEGGEIGSANSVLAIFEIVPNEKNTVKSMANISMRYTIGNDSTHQLIKHSCSQNFIPFNAIHKDLQFAAALTMFSLKLKYSRYVKNINWSDIETIAKQCVDPDNYLQNEFLQLVAKAKKIYPAKRKKRIKKE